MAAIDVSGPFVESTKGNKYVIVLSHYYTRWPEEFAIPHAQVHLVATLLIEEIIYRHGTPHTLLSDRGSNFLSKLLRELTALIGIKQIFTIPFHPQTNVLVVRFNGTLAQTISFYVAKDHRNCDKSIKPTLFVYRSAPSAIFFAIWSRS